MELRGDRSLAACTVHPSQANASNDARTARYAILCIAFQRTRSHMAVDAFALILAMLGLGLLFARLRVLRTTAPMCSTASCCTSACRRRC
ncbi:exported hypothetical protein [Xanthomonas citri pv. fuscans]|nr:exported hypothetical protein [Xanthomonas citri pv. fuscans]